MESTKHNRETVAALFLFKPKKFVNRLVAVAVEIFGLPALSPIRTAQFFFGGSARS